MSAQNTPGDYVAADPDRRDQRYQIRWHPLILKWTVRDMYTRDPRGIPLAWSWSKAVVSRMANRRNREATIRGGVFLVSRT